MPSAKLILVEDDPALAELLEFRFANEGYQVRVTADGDEALLMASEDVPDLIILAELIDENYCRTRLQHSCRKS